MVRQRGEGERAAIHVPRLGAFRILAEGRILGVPLQVVADIEVEVAVVVEVGPGRRRGPVAVAPEPRLRRGVLEPAPAQIAIQGIGPPSGDEEVGPAVVVVVAHGDAVAVAAGQRGQAGGRGDVLEAAVAAIAEEAVAERWRAAARWEGASLEGVDVEPAVAVEVEDGHAAGHGLGELVLVAGAVVEAEHEAAGGGLVHERGDDQVVRSRVGRFPTRPARPEEIGQGPAVGRASPPHPWRPAGRSRPSPRPRRTDHAGPPGPTRSWPRTTGRSPRRCGRTRRHAAPCSGRFDQPLVIDRAPHRSPPSGVAARRPSPARRPGRRGRPVARGRHHWPAPARGSPRGPTARPPGRHPGPPARPASRASWPGACPKRADGPRRAGLHRAGRPLWPIRGGPSRRRGRRAAPARNDPATRPPRRIAPHGSPGRPKPARPGHRRGRTAWPWPASR